MADVEWVADGVRILAVMAYAGVMAMAMWVALAYRDAHRRAGDGDGLLPHHVWIIALSYLLYGATASGYAVAHFGDTLNAGAVVELGAGLLGIYGLRLVHTYERHRTP